MKLIKTIGSLLIIATFAGCGKDLIQEEAINGETATLKFQISTPGQVSTKLADSFLSDAENTVRSLDLFIFDANTDTLELHKRFGNAWNGDEPLDSIIDLQSLNLEYNIKAGNKDLLFIANSQHSEEKIEQYYRGEIDSLPYYITKEAPSYYTMFAHYNDMAIYGEYNLDIELQYLVSRIVINSWAQSASMSYYYVFLKNCCASVEITKSGISSNNSSYWHKSYYENEKFIGVPWGEYELAYNSQNYINLILGIAQKSQLYFYPNTSDTPTVFLATAKKMYGGEYYLPFLIRCKRSGVSFVIDRISTKVTGIRNPDQYMDSLVDTEIIRAVKSENIDYSVLKN